MKYVTTISLCFLFAVQCLNAQTQLDGFFEKANQFFAQHIIDGIIDFEDTVTTNSLHQLVEQIKIMEINEADSLSQVSFLLNAYNLHALNEIKKLLPLNYTVYYDDFFYKTRIEIAGDKLTFNQLRNNRLAFLSNNPLFHFALIQAGLSFSMLPNYAFTPNQLNKQLEEQTGKVINHPKFLKKEGTKLILPQFLKWYKKDWLDGERSILKFIKQYYPSESEELKFVSWIKFDKVKHWTLNYYLQSIQKNADAGLTKTKKQHKRQFNKFSPAALISAGSIEIQSLNNLTQNERYETSPNQQFRTQSLQSKFGIGKTLNLGFLFNYGLGYPESNSVGPQLWLTPVKNNPNFVLEFGLMFPVVYSGLNNSHNGDDVNTNGYSFYNKIKYWYAVNGFYLNIDIGLSIENFGAYGSNLDKTTSVPINLSYYTYIGKRFRLHTKFNYSPYKSKYYQTNIKGNTLFNQTSLSFHCSKKTEISFSYGFFRNKFSFMDRGQLINYIEKWRDINLNFRFSF